MAWHANLPIRRKLTAITLLASGGALIAALAALFLTQIHLARETAVRDLSALAENVAINAAGPLAFRDRGAAQSMLDALRPEERVHQARLLDAKGVELARFSSRVENHVFPDIGASPREVRGFSIYLSQPVSYRDEPLGRLEIVADATPMLARMAAIMAVVALVVLAGALAIAYFLAARLQRAITDPLLSLASTARSIAVGNDYTLRAQRAGNDEVGELTDAFNHMLAEVHNRDLALRDAHEQLSEQVNALRHEIAERQRAEAELARTHSDLVEASRRAGQAEVATSVLHNVGNVLNSVIVAATLAVERLRTSKVGSVRLSAKLLHENRATLGSFFNDDPKGQLMLTYLPQLGECLETERTQALEELDSVIQNIEHIKEIVSTQQNYARAMGVKEKLSFVEIVEHALALNSDSLARHHLEVVRHYDDIPPFPIDKHRVLQILVNLVRNAKDALKAGALPDQRRLEIVLSRPAPNCVRLSVRDNGIGIAPENITRIFQHGFTTRRDGHGFGLHSGALTARQLGGQLFAESAGIGHGAVFTLEVPCELPAS